MRLNFKAEREALLKEIQRGTVLKITKTDDKSTPMITERLSGMRPTDATQSPESDPEREALLPLDDDRQPLLLKDRKKPPGFIRFFLHYEIDHIDVDSEHLIRITTVVESFRVLFYYGLLVTFGIGFLLTYLYVDHDHTSIIKDVFGGLHIATYFSYPPASYVAPLVYLFPMFAMWAYNVCSMVLIWISYHEERIGSIQYKLLTASHLYAMFSVAWLGTSFAVQPEREQPESMYFAALPYLNAKIALCFLQIGVVWFGGAVSWKNLFDPCGRKFFLVISWVHVVLYFLSTAIGALFVVNGLGDMGENLNGHGLWWSVKDETMAGCFNVFVDKLGFLLGFMIPLLQSSYLKYQGTKDLSKNHNIIFYVSDDQQSATIKHNE